MKAHELLNTEEKWTKGVYAVNKNNKMCTSRSPEAAKWCVAGALQKCYNFDLRMNAEDYKIYQDAVSKLRNYVKPLGMIISEWNDCSEYQEVHKTLKELDI